jgi:hypothetical protein
MEHIMGGTGSYDPGRIGGGGSGGPPQTTSCLDLAFPATVQLPPTPIVVAAGSVLEVCRATVGGAPVVAVYDADGHLVGSVVDELQRLLSCLSQGIAFIAEATTSGSGPDVVVRAADPARVQASPATPSAPISAHGRVGLVPEGDELPMNVVHVDGAGQVGLDHPVVCELRALVRVGVTVITRPGPGTAVTLTVR